MTYQPLIPTGSVPLNQDYVNLKNNFNQINTQFNVDHVPLTSVSGNPPNGYHEAIHLVPVSTTTSNPPDNQPINGYTGTSGFGQLFNAQINDDINPDEALYFLTGGGRLMQLTRNFLPIAEANGCTFLAGGLILQWGQTTASGTGTRNVLFENPPNNFDFPGNCFIVIAQPIAGTAGGGGGYIVSNRSTTGFSFISTPTQFPSGTPVNWIALGN